MKEAKIKCPCCGTSITVRQKDDNTPLDVMTDIEEGITDLFRVVDSAFKRVFGKGK